MSRFAISIVTPSYNQGQFLQETIHSSICQDYPVLELILADGGSTDKSLEVIEEYQKYLSWWVSEKDNGQSHAINKGLRNATGDILNWINSDDYLEPGALKAIEAAFVDPAVNVYIGRSNIVQGSTILRQSRGTDVYYGNLPKTLGQARIDQPEHWWRKSVIDEIGPLNENLYYTMDRDWWIKYLLIYGLNGIKKEDTILANFRLHDKSKTVSQNVAFSRERNMYYNSLASYYGLSGISDFIHEKTGMGKIELTDMPRKINLSILEQSFAYFFLLLADEAYVQGDHSSVKTFLSKIDKNVLQDEDVAFYDKLYHRAKLPASLIQIARKWRS